MTIRLHVDLSHPPAPVRAFLRDPANRPRWQSSLRAVADVTGGGEVGTTWRDVTWPGLRPALVVVEDTPGRWAETGEWRGWRADLALDLEPRGGGTRVGVVADVVPPALLRWLRRPLEALAARAIAADLRSVERLLPRGAHRNG